MNIPRSVAVVFDNTLRPDTTGVHCLRALMGLTQATHFLPSQLSDCRQSTFELFLRIDDGIPFEWPAHLHPSACWLIDTHMDFAPRLHEAARFDYVFAAQRNGADRLRAEGVPHAQWMPLACDPQLHRRHDVRNQWDIGFVGAVHPYIRSRLIALLKNRYPRSYFGRAYGEELAKTYSASHIAFNCPVADDINMRVFEALGCGVALTTSDLSANGQAEMFRDGVHLIAYANVEELLDKVSFYLKRPESRATIARQGQAEVYAHHTYKHRMELVLRSCAERHAQTARPSFASRTSIDLLDTVDVLIKSFLRPKALLRLLRSIRTFYPSLHLTVADDGGIETASDSDSLACIEFLRQDERTTLHSLRFGVGVAAGRNCLIERTSRPNLLFLDDDFIFTEDTRIEHLLQTLTERSFLGVVAGVCIDVQGKQRETRRSRGTLHFDGTSLVHDTSAWVDEQIGLCDYFPTFALFRRAIFEQGVEWRGGVGGEHYDLCLQLQKSGWQTAIDSAVRIDHGREVESLPGYYEHRFDFHQWQQWLLRTWNVQRVIQDGNVICELDRPSIDNDEGESRTYQNSAAEHFVDNSYFQFARPDVLALVPASARRVLDIGCGAGCLGQAIKLRQGAHVTGIELNSAAAQAAERRLDRVFALDVETADWPFQNELFDCVIVADILEHLRWPERLLSHIRQSLSSAGMLVASLPNARNHSVVSSLLGGHWTYEAAGILDHTHLRFFTRRETEKLLFRTGFGIVECRAKPDEAFEQWRQLGRPDQVFLGSLRIDGLPPDDAAEFYAYQFLVAATPTPRRDHGLTSIIILTHNELAYTKMCLDSIRMRTDEAYELIVVDNASTDGTVDYLRSLSGVRVVENRENRGFPAGVNQGLQVATGRQVLLLNNDTIVTTGWLRRMLDCLYSDPKVGLVGPTSNQVSGVQCIPATYDLGSLDGFAWDWGKANDAKRIETDRIVGFCLLARRDLVDEIGGLDERFGIGNYEDDDYCLRAIQAGYRCLVAFDSFVHHFGSRTFLGTNIDAGALMTRNSELFAEKWTSKTSPIGDPVSLPRTTTETGKRTFHVEPTSSGALLLKRHDIKLSLCMIVRDNQQTIGAALQSIAPWVDEMIVVDTGSRDRTAEIAEALGARVFHFPWPDSFAIARNESLRHASGDWIFWMDSDDTISAENGRKLRDLMTAAAPPSTFGYIMQVHCPSELGEGVEDVTVVDHIKLFRNRDDLRFEGRIHEQIMPAIRAAGGDVVWTDIFVLHSGSDLTPAGRKRKQERDLRLLRLEEKERPDNSFVLFNIGMTFADMDDHANAVSALERSIAASDPSESHLRKAYALLTASLCHLQRFQQANDVCRAGLRLFPEDVELSFRDGFVAHHLGQFDRAIGGYRKALSSCGPRHFSSMDRGLRGYKTRHNLALVYEDLQQHPFAEEQWRLVVAEMPTYRLGWRGLVGNLVLQGQFDRASREVGRMLQHCGDVADVYWMSSRIAAAQADTDAARRQLEKGLQIEPTNEELLDEMCKLQFEVAEPEETVIWLRQLISLNSKSASAWHNLGSTYLRLKRYTEADEAFRTAIKLRPNSAVSYLYLGFAKEQMGNHADARDAWRHAVAANPGDQAAREAQDRLNAVLGSSTD